MCGIAGIWSETEGSSTVEEKPNERVETIGRALGKIRHRGPDDQGYAQHSAKSNAAYLGHTRLSIVDVEKGHQPFVDERNGTRAVCNGEIYNHGLLRKKVNGQYQFSSKSDCEIIVPLHQEQGPQAVKSLDGMFAFLISDGKGFFAGRDPIGIKPLYYGYQGADMVFASEAKCLDGCVDEIREFPNGHFYHSTQGFVPYYKIPNPHESQWLEDEAEILAKIRATLEKSVKKRMMADVPVGVFLSGGLDSSLVAALARQHCDVLHSFAVGMEGSADIVAAREVSNHLGTIHHEVIFNEEDVQKCLKDVVYHLECADPALIRSAVPNWFVAKLASSTKSGDEYFKVVLTGEGADEIFAGYRYLDAIDDNHKLQEEMRRLTAGLHNLNLQRNDRMTMAHGLEARVPFLDLELIDLALHIHPKLKLHSAYGCEKGLLRKAFTDLLPHHLLYRTKTEFGQGSTVGDWLKNFVEKEVSDDDFVEARSQDPQLDKEAFFYSNLVAESIKTPFAKDAMGAWRGPVL